jgi:hypothetical protein
VSTTVGDSRDERQPVKIEQPFGPDQVIRLHVTRAGGHLRVRVWIGQAGSPGMCGELTMRFSDWAHFNYALLYGSASPLARVGVIMEDGLRAWLNANAPRETITGTVDAYVASSRPDRVEAARSLTTGGAA